MSKPTVPERFWTKVDLLAPSGCWIWLASCTKDGYGQFFPAPGKGMVAHKWAYLWLVGAYDDGLQLDHLCRVPQCVNPDHLEPVTPRENMLRSSAGEASKRRAADKTHCKNGHEYTPEGTKMRGGARICRQCERDALKRYHARKRVDHG